LRFALGGHPDNPGELRVVSTTPWRLDGVPLYALHLEREAAEPGRFVSTIAAGELRLLASDQVLVLRRGDRLDLGRLRDARLFVAFDPQTRRFKIQLDARAARLRTGPPGFERNRAPTALERVYHQQQLALLWGSLAFLWGLFWGLRGWLRR
jgi:hypothetical protein